MLNTFLQPAIFYVAHVIILFMTRISAEPGEIACARLLQTMFTICFVFLPSLSNRKYAGPRPPSGLIREGRREHGGADKTLIA